MAVLKSKVHWTQRPENKEKLAALSGKRKKNKKSEERQSTLLTEHNDLMSRIDSRIVAIDKQIQELMEEKKELEKLLDSSRLESQGGSQIKYPQ